MEPGYVAAKDEWIEKMHYIHKMKCYSAIKENSLTFLIAEKKYLNTKSEGGKVYFGS